MPRNQEVIRQWKVLQALASARRGAGIAALASDLSVTTRTIRGGLAALQEAGFPLFDERNEDGRVCWRLESHAFRDLESGFTLNELCALYLGRHLLDAVGMMPFQRDLALAFTRIERLLTPRMRQFLDRLPSVITAKPGPRAAPRDRTADVVGRLLESTLQGRVCTMTYHSLSSGVVRVYRVHPQRLVFALGGLYLLAYVPAYRDTRTFAVDRIARVSLDKQTFAVSPGQHDDVFANSLGVNTGPAAIVEVEFAARVAPYVRARVWHGSQQLRELSDGKLLLTMNVCHDWALRSWILGWGPFARVRSPRALARDLRRDIEEALSRYVQGE